MRKKINGHIYDTRTAKEVASHSCGPDDCGWKDEYILYRTRRGMWFVYHGTWVDCDYHRTFRWCMQPIDDETAKVWQERCREWNSKHTA